MNNLRSIMPALSNKAYFNYGGQGPLPTSSLEAIIRSWQKIQELGPFSNKIWPYISHETNSLRKLLAKMCGVEPHRLALTENVTSGCVLPLWGLPFSSGDRILISDSEHPGVIGACHELARRLNLFIDIFKIQQIQNGYKNQSRANEMAIECIERKLTKKTRLVVISHLLWNTGQIMPIPSISQKLLKHPNKPFLLVDGAQSFGQIPVEDAASSSDIFAFTGHKWACGPEGLGGVAISERVLAESNPTLIGWKSIKDEHLVSHNYFNGFHKDSRRFEIATSCIPLMAGLRNSLKLIEEEGSALDRLKLIRLFSKKLWQNLSQIKNIHPILSAPPPSGIVSFSVNKECPYNELVNILCEKDLFIRSIEYPKCLRACVHITTNAIEIESLINHLKKL